MADPALTIGQLVEQYQAGVLARDAEAMARLVESYGRVYTQITAQADALIAEVENERMAAEGQARDVAEGNVGAMLLREWETGRGIERPQRPVNG